MLPMSTGKRDDSSTYRSLIAQISSKHVSAVTHGVTLPHTTHRVWICQSLKVFCLLPVCGTTAPVHVGQCLCLHLEHLVRAEGTAKGLCSCESPVWISGSVLSPLPSSSVVS